MPPSPRGPSAGLPRLKRNKSAGPHVRRIPGVPSSLLWGSCKATQMGLGSGGAASGLRITDATPVLPLTSVCLSVGEERASTLSFGQILSIRSCSIWRGVWYVGGVRERNRAPCSHWALRGHTSWLLFKHAVPKPPGPLLSLARGRAFVAATCAYLPLLIADPPVELFALQAQEILPRVDNATLDGNGPGCVDIVTSDHADCDPCPLALADGFWDLHKTVRAMREGVTLAGSPCLQGVRATSSPR